MGLEKKVMEISDLKKNKVKFISSFVTFLNISKPGTTLSEIHYIVFATVIMKLSFYPADAHPLPQKLGLVYAHTPEHATHTRTHHTHTEDIPQVQQYL